MSKVDVYLGVYTKRMDKKGIRMYKKTIYNTEYKSIMIHKQIFSNYEGAYNEKGW